MAAEAPQLAEQAAPAAPPASPATSPAPEPAKHANRLAKETSPYLLLHAHNPVDWYPWGQEALDKAKRENKLIFLSIGYSSCYWCHVMERKCFMDPQIAAYLNEHFVAIKVDREERPDLDDIYMTALQIYYANTGSPQAGGWPLSMFLTPQAQPLMGGTYFPPEQFTEVLERVQDRWQNDRQSLTTLGEKFAEIVATHMKGRVPLEQVALEAARLNDIQTALAEQFDPEYGGFGYSEADAERPKFPDASNLLFLLARARGGDEAAGKMLRLSLDRMAAGGIRDHLGGGFHRYSTDRYWRVPHFEKMLYDQGQLASVYAQGYALTKDPAWKQAGEETCDYVLREFTAPSGGFTSALDAETDGKEGAYYAWTADEAKKALTPEEYELAAEVYGLNGAPNFEEAFVLLEAKPLAQIAAARGQTVAQVQAALAPVQAKLLAARNKRKRPLVDTKVLTAWNGLMIRGLAEAGKTFENPKYTDAAARAANFVLDSLKATDGRLLRIPGGDPALKGYLEDYAYFIDGLLALHQATGDPRWLEAAEKLQAKQDELFWDAERGGYFFTSSDHEQLIARVKNPVDSATPSGNAVSAGNLVYLAKAAGKPEYRERAGKIFAAFGPQLQETPSAVPRLGLALGEWLAQAKPQ
ncbi:MAG: thioredoxin domain-containing protein [Pirellulales bacterium]